jgi:hypothetical protein
MAKEWINLHETPSACQFGESLTYCLSSSILLIQVPFWQPVCPYYLLPKDKTLTVYVMQVIDIVAPDDHNTCIPNRLQTNK